MVDQLTVMERVANTPIPRSCEFVGTIADLQLIDRWTDGIHLKQCVTLYLFALPLTLVHEMGWAIVPIVTVVAFTFMGIEGIAEEIEMPFGELNGVHPGNSVTDCWIGTDERDLPLGKPRLNTSAVRERR